MFHQDVSEIYQWPVMAMSMMKKMTLMIRRMMMRMIVMMVMMRRVVMAGSITFSSMSLTRSLFSRKCFPSFWFLELNLFCWKSERLCYTCLPLFSDIFCLLFFTFAAQTSTPQLWKSESMPWKHLWSLEIYKFDSVWNKARHKTQWQWNKWKFMSQTNATNVTLHRHMQEIWGLIWKYTV